MRGLRGAFLEMGGLFGDELRNFSPAVVAGGHDVLEFLEGLVGLVEVALVVGIVLVGLV